MIEEICRLCFEQKPRPMGIFSDEGEKLKVASVIEMHFADEVRAIDCF